jgi:hypothetical protein
VLTTTAATPRFRLIAATALLALFGAAVAVSGPATQRSGPGTDRSHHGVAVDKWPKRAHQR